jgi:hypothetical protein
MKNIWFKIISSIAVVALFLVQQVVHAIGSPQLVTTPPLDWSICSKCEGSMIFYYNEAVQTSTTFSLIYIIIVLLLLWLPKRKAINSNT